ncbi:MAG: hypothetical protein GY864_06525 [Desulfobacterales bacterium]|nr:hypothetical protein [Desulfobacterales bacterium]
MNRFAYLTTGLAVKALSRFSKVNVHIHGKENIPEGSIIFVVNHFTRIETLLLPYHIHRMTNVPVWSLADHNLFEGGLGRFLDMVGAMSTKDPDRDHLMVKSLLKGEAFWIIFPEGRMVKNKKIMEKGRFMVSHAEGKHAPHTGAATLALRTEFYRKRLREISGRASEETKRLMDFFQIDSIEPVIENSTYIVPVNITYYPMRARENIVSKLFTRVLDDVPERMLDEIMTEGAMLLSGVDADIRFGEPINIKEFMIDSAIDKDVSSGNRIDFDDPIPSRQVMRKASRDIMQRYMSDIYSMTTVNHDHLFASMLKQMPFNKVDEHDLRRRVFLAATRTWIKKISIYMECSRKTRSISLRTIVLTSTRNLFPWSGINVLLIKRVIHSKKTAPCFVPTLISIVPGLIIPLRSLQMKWNP